MCIASGGAADSRYHPSPHLTNTSTGIQNVYGMPAQYKKNMAAVEYRPNAEGAGHNRDVSMYQRVNCDRSVVRRRYDRIANLIPLFDRSLFVPWNFRKNAACSTSAAALAATSRIS